jgi:putative salt-induced outer membrane protein
MEHIRNSRKLPLYSRTARPQVAYGTTEFQEIPMFTRTILSAVAFMLAAPSAFAQAETEEEEGPWSGKVSFGYLSTSGNTENSNLNGNFEIGYAKGKWSHLLDAYAINASESGDTTAEAYGAGWLSERAFSETNFLFLRLNYRNDRFSGYPTQFSQTAGYGRRIFNTGAHLLNAEIGGGARQSERADGVDEDDFIVNGRLAYKWQFSETANFTQDFLLEYGQKNTYFQSISAVRAQLIGQLAMVASYTIKNNSDVPAGIEKTDTYTALTLEYAF